MPVKTIYQKPWVMIRGNFQFITLSQSGLNEPPPQNLIPGACNGICDTIPFSAQCCNSEPQSGMFIQFILEGNVLSFNQLLTACDVLIDGNPANEQGASLTNPDPPACGNGFVYSLFLPQSGCSANILISCDGYEFQEACDTNSNRCA
jgi:hypothetical protein